MTIHITFYKLKTNNLYLTLKLEQQIIRNSLKIKNNSYIPSK